MKKLLTTTMALGLVTAVSLSQPVTASSLGAGLSSQNQSQILLVRGHGGGGGAHGGERGVGGEHGADFARGRDMGGHREGEAKREADRAIDNHPNAAIDTGNDLRRNQWDRGAWDTGLGVDGGFGGSCVDLNGDGNCDVLDEVID